MSRHRFLILLLSLLLLLLVVPFLRHLGPGARFVFNAAFAALLLSSVYAVSERRNQFLTAGIMAAISLSERIVTLFLKSESATFRLAGLVMEAACFGYIVVLIIRYVLAARRVTFNMICASLCAYLLLGTIWSLLYLLIVVLPGSFPELVSERVFSPDLLSGHAEEMDVVSKLDVIHISTIYFSFVTLTTLGYGDITPVSDVARMLAIVEAIVGQFFLAVLVARLVGLHIAAPREESSG